MISTHVVGYCYGATKAESKKFSPVFKALVRYISTGGKRGLGKSVPSFALV
jgi:hypothetical protein